MQLRMTLQQLYKFVIFAEWLSALGYWDDRAAGPLGREVYRKAG